MKDFMYSYTTKVYFGDGAAKKALQTELAGIGKTIMTLAHFLRSEGHARLASTGIMLGGIWNREND